MIYSQQPAVIRKKNSPAADGLGIHELELSNTMPLAPPMTGGWFMTLFYPHYSNFVESWNEIRIGEARDLGLDTFIWDYLEFGWYLFNIREKGSIPRKTCLPSL